MNYSKLVFTVICMLAIIVFINCAKSTASDSVVREAYMKYYNAMQKGDLSALKNCVVEEKLKEFEGEDAQEKLNMVKAFMPANVTVSSVSVAADKATLSLEADNQGQKMKGTAEMVFQGNNWKIEKEKWNMEMGG
ncbi:MAG: hypothetical protein ABIH42_04625 [Planctomycetota bacterium]